jgi:hypothetical protein
MSPDQRDQLLSGLSDGSIVPYLGAGVLSDVKNVATGAPIPATSDELILAMNDGRPMAPKLMYEFPRAAMNVELKRGRSTVTRFLNRTYGEAEYTRPTTSSTSTATPSCRTATPTGSTTSSSASPASAARPSVTSSTPGTAAATPRSRPST